MDMSVTIKDIARVCDVSYSNVSRVLNKKNVRQNAKNDHILATARALGYTPHNIARQLVTKEKDTIGMIIPDVSNPHYSEITKSVQDYANGLGYQVLISNTDWDIVKEAAAEIISGWFVKENPATPAEDFNVSLVVYWKQTHDQLPQGLFAADPGHEAVQLPSPPFRGRRVWSVLNCSRERFRPWMAAAIPLILRVRCPMVARTSCSVAA